MATGANSSICRQAIQALQPISAAARANPNNVQAIVQAVHGVLPRLRSLASQATASTKTALTNVESSLQTIGNFTNSQTAAKAGLYATVQLGNVCAGSL